MLELWDEKGMVQMETDIFLCTRRFCFDLTLLAMERYSFSLHGSTDLFNVTSVMLLQWIFSLRGKKQKRRGE